MLDELGDTLADVKELGALLERRREQELTPAEFERATELVHSARRKVTQVAADQVTRRQRARMLGRTPSPEPRADAAAAPRARPRERRRSTAHGPPDREPDPPPRPPEAA